MYRMMSEKGTKKREISKVAPRNDEIPCCIVDDHCDCIPFLHAGWKAKRIQFADLSLLHIDSHPDLSPPPCSVTKMYDKNYLYELLEERGGISEFIIPLVVNGHLGRGITWLHQSWANQIELGKSVFCVGDNENDTCCVSSDSPYYFDEGLSYHEHELKNSVKLELLSCHDDYFISEKSLPTNEGPWILDICLDYFTVSNPSLKTLQSALTEHGFTEDIIVCLSDMFHAVRFRLDINRKSKEGSYARNEYTFSKRREERALFHELLEHFLDSEETDFIETSEKAAAFLNLFDLDCIPHAIPAQAHPAKVFLENVLQLPRQIRLLIKELGVTMLATLPHHEGTWIEVEAILSRLDSFLRDWTITKGGQPPEAICIARSDGDGFTDSALVNKLQEEVLRMLDGLTKEIWNINATINICDMTEDPFIAASTFFMSSQAIERFKVQRAEGQCS